MKEENEEIVIGGRRQQTKQELGIEKEERKIEKSIDKEEKRKARKLEKKMMIEESSSYSSVKGIATIMDKYYLDPILGLIPSGIGDLISSLFSFPFIYVSLFKVRSIPLTLAVIYNTLVDIAIGMLPLYIGNVLDFLKRSYKQNLKLIVGFVEDDKEIIKEVNSKALVTAFLIALFIYLIYQLFVLIKYIATTGIDFISNLF